MTEDAPIISIFDEIPGSTEPSGNRPCVRSFPFSVSIAGQDLIAGMADVTCIYQGAPPQLKIEKLGLRINGELSEDDVQLVAFLVLQKLEPPLESSVIGRRLSSGYVN